jgi:hypothetical protein
LLFLLALIGSKPYSSVITFALAAGWHIAAIFRDSMLLERLQFAVAQSGNPTSTSLRVTGVSENRFGNVWNNSQESVESSATPPEERRMMLLTWIRQTFLTRRVFAMASVTTGLMVVSIWLANSLIPHEVDNFSVSCDGTYFVGSLLTQNGKLYAKCLDYQSGKSDVTREICVGNASLALLGKPAICYGLNGYRVKLFYYLDNNMIACYDGEARVFHVPDSR